MNDDMINPHELERGDVIEIKVRYMMKHTLGVERDPFLICQDIENEIAYKVEGVDVDSIEVIEDDG